jgi:general secretion pathway protein D
VVLCLLVPLQGAWATHEGVFTFENAEIHTVIKKVGELTGITFLFDPEQVKGKITLLAPQPVAPEQALKLLQSALALHGYSIAKQEEGTWIIPTEPATVAPIIEVVPLQYARADEMAYILSWVVPHGVRIVPYAPTNSLIISGDPRAVQELIKVIRGQEKKDSR